MIQIIIIVSIALLAAFFVGTFLKKNKSKFWSKIIWSTVIHTLFLWVILFFGFNRPSMVFSEGFTYQNSRYYINNFLTPRDTNEAYKFVTRNFIFIDNSRDKYLIPDPESDVSSNQHIVISDRSKISTLIEMVRDSIDIIDLMVFDLSFSDYSKDDSSLRKSILFLVERDKVLLADDEGASGNEILTFERSIYGSVKQDIDNGTLSMHTLFNNQFSLPYKIYGRLQSVKESTPLFFNNFIDIRGSYNLRKYAFNSYLPSFKIVDENKLLRVVDHSIDSTLHYFRLGDAVNKDINTDFLKNLSIRKKLGYKNVVFVGAFDTDTEDKHNTVFGSMHGPVILLNLIYSLVSEQHIVKSTSLIINFIFLFILNLFITWRVYKKKTLETFTKTSIDLLLSGFIFIPVLIFGFFCEYITQQNSNLTSLVFYFVSYNGYLKSFLFLNTKHG